MARQTLIMAIIITMTTMSMTMITMIMAIDHTDHTDQNEIIRYSVRTTLSLVKAGLATTGQKATTLRVRFTVTDGNDGIDGNGGKRISKSD